MVVTYSEYINIKSENLMENDNLQKPGVDESQTLKLIFKQKDMSAN